MCLKKPRMKRQYLLFLTLWMAFFVNAQDAQFTKDFINKTNLAINKVQKEIIRSGNTSYESKFKEALGYQSAAVQSYQTDLTHSYNLSHHSLLLCVAILDALNPTSAVYFKPSQTENEIIINNLNHTGNLLDKYLSKQKKEEISLINISTPGSLKILNLNID